MSRPTLPNSLVYALIFVMGLASGEGLGNAGHLASIRQKKSAKSRRPTPEAIWKGIKVAAQNEVRSNSLLIIFPTFSVKYVGSTPQLTIAKGDVGELGFRDDPYDLPFRKQILIEALRHSLSGLELTVAKAPNPNASSSQQNQGGSPVERAWDLDLARAETLVKQIVFDIESEPNQTRLQEKLREDERQIDDLLYDKIYQAVQQAAQRKRYNIIYGRGGGDIKKFSVNIITVPEGAKVLMMTDLVYRKQLIMKTNRSQWPWIEIVQSPYQLLGRYRYLTIWPDGKHAEGSIDVANGSPLRFLPNQRVRE
jgi:hypothetical protein